MKTVSPLRTTLSYLFSLQKEFIDQRKIKDQRKKDIYFIIYIFKKKKKKHNEWTKIYGEKNWVNNENFYSLKEAINLFSKISTNGIREIDQLHNVTYCQEIFTGNKIPFTIIVNIFWQKN